MITEEELRAADLEAKFLTRVYELRRHPQFAVVIYEMLECARDHHWCLLEDADDLEQNRP